MGKNRRAGPSNLEIKFYDAWLTVSQGHAPDPLWHNNGGEHQFHPDRKWRLDFAWPDLMICVEIQGGVFAGRGRHSGGAGQVADYEKHNEATRLGWDIYYFTVKDLERDDRCLEAAVFMFEVVRNRLDELGAIGKLLS